MMHLYKKVDPNNTYPVQDRLRQFIDGLREELREQVEISCPTTLNDALSKASAVEAAYSRHVPLGSYSIKKNYLGQTDGTLNEINELKKTIASLTNIVKESITSRTSSS